MSTRPPLPRPSRKALGLTHTPQPVPRHAADMPPGTPAQIKVREKGAPKELGEIHEGTRKTGKCEGCTGKR
jgi:hypothetical protein